MQGTGEQSSTIAPSQTSNRLSYGGQSGCAESESRAPIIVPALAMQGY